VDAAPLDHDDVEVVASNDSPIDESASETTDAEVLPPELGGDESPSEEKQAALVPYDPLSRYLAEVRRFPLPHS